MMFLLFGHDPAQRGVDIGIAVERCGAIPDKMRQDSSLDCYCREANGLTPKQAGDQPKDQTTQSAKMEASTPQQSAVTHNLRKNGPMANFVLAEFL